MNQQIYIGADPEVFLVRAGRVVPSIGIVPGSKHVPTKTEHGWVQPDNVLAEFNIKPAASRIEFLHSIRSVMQDLQVYGDLAVLASYEFSKEELKAAGRAAFEFGCDPDYNAWTGARNPRPNPRAVGGLRTAGGHIHVGADVALARPQDVIRGMDVLLGLQSVITDTDSRRRSVYGKAGAMRMKPYGVEYRTLSNFWLASDDLVLWAYDQTRRVLDNLDELSEFCSIRGTAVQAAINESDVAAAQQLLEEANQCA